MKREDDFKVRHEHLKNLSDEELKERFWSLTEEIVRPLVDLAYNNTSPSIERSVLLRMGFNSMEAEAIVSEGIKWNLIGKGMGNIVLQYAKLINIPYMEAGRNLANGSGWKEVNKFMREDINA
ncbi:MAG: ornithine aminomutase subunit alpha [Bacillota bacterium]|nr:ornithine aminomutase subunit alpha [Bacillota bacterium]